MLDKIRSAALHYLEVYFVQRNLPGTLALFDSEITVCGTGMDEVGYRWEEVASLYERDLFEAPNPVYYELKRLQVSSPRPGVGVVFGELNIHTQILSQELRLNNMRLSLVLTETHEAWQVAHMHLSLPTRAHEEGEAYPIKELEERNRVLQRLVDEKTRRLDEAFHEMARLASTDKLTRLFNRMKMDECLDSDLKRSERYGNRLAVILADVDYFKSINDRYGHLAGDQVLTEFAALLTQRVRKTDIVGRWGGEEFLVLCPETGLENAQVMAEDIRARVEGHQFPMGVHVTLSVGVTVYHPQDTRDTLLSRVDNALYGAKRDGRNRVAVA